LKNGGIFGTVFIAHVAPGEDARRYYSSKEFSLFGVPNVFAPMTSQSDTKFFDIQNTWYRFDIQPLKRSLERFAKFPIATEWEDAQPRLLLISVDVATSYQAVFDSFKRKDGTRCTEYGNHIRKDDGTPKFEYLYVMMRALLPIMLLLVHHSQLTLIR
jgi:NTE family protein